MNLNLHPAERIAACMRRIYAQRLTTTSGGNVSLRDDSGVIWITGAGTDKATVAADQVVGVYPDKSGHAAKPDSPLQPSSELPFHAAIYAERSDIHAIVHAHPTVVVAGTLLGRVPDLRLIPSAYEVCGDVGWTDYCTPGTAVLGQRLATVFAQGHNTALMQNHGVVVAADTLEMALRRFETLEFTARTLDAASAIGRVKSISAADFQTCRQRLSKQEFQPNPPALADPAVGRRPVNAVAAATLSEIMRRGYRRHLLISGRGSLSVRTASDTYLVSPPQTDYGNAEAAHLMELKLGQCALSSTQTWHDRIYAEHPDVQAIIHAYAPFATAFSISHRPFSAATIPESYLVLREVQMLPAKADANALARRLTLETPTAILAFDGAIVVGRSLIEAFDRLEVLNATAETIVHASRLGSIQLLSDEQLADLDA